MEELKLISTETLRDLIYEKFERMPDYPKTAEEEDPLAKVCILYNAAHGLFANLDLLSKARVEDLPPRESLK